MISENVCAIDLGLLSSNRHYEVNFDMTHNIEGDIEIPPLQTPLVEVVNLNKLIGELILFYL